MKTVVMLLMINGNYTVDVSPIYFDDMAACNTALPAVTKQVHDLRFQLGGQEVTAVCYYTGERPDAP